jgi:hypothetical protein
MDGFGLDITPPSVTERSARVVESERIQDEKHRRRQDPKRKQRKWQRSDEGKKAGDEEKGERETGRSLDLEA